MKNDIFQFVKIIIFLNISLNKNEDGKNNYELSTMNYELNFLIFA